jgi:cephalosporin hydroxylase
MRTRAVERVIDIDASVMALAVQFDELDARNGRPFKLAEDLERYRRVIEVSVPEIIVECGTFQGWSAEWFSSLGPEVVTIDIDLEPSRQARELGEYRDRITYLRGRSTHPDIIGLITELVDDRRCMVVLDSDHSAENVRAEILTYGPLVTLGCFLVVEDGLARWLPGEWYADPLAPIEELLSSSKDWIQAREIEDMFPVSTNPAGWWRRA